MLANITTVAVAVAEVRGGAIVSLGMAHLASDGGGGALALPAVRLHLRVVLVVVEELARVETGGADHVAVDILQAGVLPGARGGGVVGCGGGRGGRRDAERAVVLLLLLDLPAALALSLRCLPCVLVLPCTLLLLLLLLLLVVMVLLLLLLALHGLEHERREAWGCPGRR